MLRKNEQFLVVSLLTLLSFVIPYTLRAYDDNRLTSWLWVFDHVAGDRVFLFTGVSLLIAFVLTRRHIPIRYPLLALFSAAFGVSTLFRDVPEMIVDSSRYFTQAKYLELYGPKFFLQEWGMTIPSWTDLPLVPFLYGIIFGVLGESRLYIQVVTSLLFSLTCVITALIGEELWDRETGLTAGLLLLGIPYLLIQVPLMLVDVPTMFFFALAVLATAKAVRYGGTVRIALSGFAVFLALLTKYSTWVVLVTIPMVLIMYLFDSVRGRAGAETEASKGIGEPPVHRTVFLRRGLVIAMGSGILLCGALILKSDVFFAQAKLLLAYQKPGLGRWGESFVSTFLFQTHPLVSGLAVWSLLKAWKKRDKRYLITGGLLLMVFVFQIRRMRYILPLFPMLTLMASYGLQHVRESNTRKFVASCIVLSSLTLAYVAYLPFCRTMSAANIRDTGMFLDAMGIDKAEVTLVYNREVSLNPAVVVPLLDFFTKATLHHVPDGPVPVPEESVERSPLRFTWEYELPGYYGESVRGEPDTVMVISDDPEGMLPDALSQRLGNYRLLKVFRKDEGVFEFKTFVALYKREHR